MTNEDLSVGEMFSKIHAKGCRSILCDYVPLVAESYPGCQTLISVLTIWNLEQGTLKYSCALVFLLCQHPPIEVYCELHVQLKCSRESH